jgi:voltage-gated potassium channel
MKHTRLLHYLDAEGVGPWPLFLRAAFIACVVIAVAAAALTTLPEASPALARTAHVVHVAVAILFTVEYLLRLAVAHERRGAAPRVRVARLEYALSPIGLIDLFAAASFWLALVNLIPLRIEAVLTLVAVCKLVRYAPGLDIIATVFRQEARPLASAVLALFVILTIASGIMFLIEHDAQPTVFASIPDTMWWGMVTVASVGYGDMAPMTPLGKAFASVVMLFGLAMFAVPAGILASGFASELRRRDFIVTWESVAQVPLFNQLDASRIAAIARLLRPQIIPTHHVVVRRGEPADAMYFIMDGEVEIDLHPTPVRLKKGQHFGEIALLKKTSRTATVTTIMECRLLALDAHDFHRLMAQHPELASKIARITEERLRAVMASANIGAAAEPPV